MNQRTKLTKQIIKQSFFALLKEKPISKITVTKICEESGINRTTFCKCYLDVWDLLNQIESDLAFEMNLFIKKGANHDFITQGDTAVVMDWIEGGMVESDETVATFINQLNHSLINQALKVNL